MAETVRIKIIKGIALNIKTVEMIKRNNLRVNKRVERGCPPSTERETLDVGPKDFRLK